MRASYNYLIRDGWKEKDNVSVSRGGGTNCIILERGNEGLIHTYFEGLDDSDYPGHEYKVNWLEITFCLVQTYQIVYKKDR